MTDQSTPSANDLDTLYRQFLAREQRACNASSYSNRDAVPGSRTQALLDKAKLPQVRRPSWND